MPSFADLSRKENTAPEIQRSNPRSILNGNVKRENDNHLPGGRRKRLSVSEVSDMLFEFYKTKSAKAPKQPDVNNDKYGQVSPTSAETLEPSSIAAIAVYGAAETASKNLNADEMLGTAAENATFHPRFKYALKTSAAPINQAGLGVYGGGGLAAIPTSVLVSNTAAIATAGPHSKPQAAVIAEALIRNGMHNFQQQLRAQEILRQQAPPRRLKNEADSNGSGGIGALGGIGVNLTPTKILENLLRKQQERDLRHSECENDPGSATEDEDYNRYHAFDDIHLMDQQQQHHHQQQPQQQQLHQQQEGSQNLFSGSNNSMIDAQTHALRNLEFTLSDYGSSNGSTLSPNGIGLDGEPVYECRHCGKKYRWKSTLRRHENVECGGKEPSHQCPYCPYKSKQRGNLGVHVRKHHTDLPQLPSKRRSKYSIKCEQGIEMGLSISMAGSNGSISDDSQGKLVIDCNK